MGEVLSILLTGAMISSVYALMALGFTLIMGLRGVLNLSHGALIMVGAYAFFVANQYLPGAGALVVAVAAGAVASYLVYVGLVRYTEEDLIITFMVTIVVALALQAAATYFFSSEARSLVPLVSGGVHLVGTTVRLDEALAFVVSWIAIGLLYYFVTETRTGQAILASSMSRRGALLNGVDLGRVNAITWLVAGALAGLAGVFLGALQSTSPTMWADPLALSFIIVVIGGVGSIKGSLVGAYVIGFLQTITSTVGSSQYRGLFALVLLVVIILLKPEGLFGREFLE